LKTKINENGEDVVCLDMPYSSKVRNECNNYHYFYHYKRERCEELRDVAQAMALSPNSVETGYAQRMLEESERDMETILKRVK